MKAYQLIYTGCGKDRSGAFSVWSKSEAITPQEASEIAKLMDYKKSINAPEVPPTDGAEDLFPIKHAYFELSSGRKCVAQSSYVGKMYSDGDNRYGNFLLHAFVFDEVDDDFNPYQIFGTDLFKTQLSYTEWHDTDAPDDLPMVDIANTTGVDKDKVREYIANHKDAFASLMEACMLSANDGQFIYINDIPSEQRYAYEALSLLLPRDVLLKLTFAEQYLPAVDYALKASRAVLVKVRSMAVDALQGMFSYKQKKAEGVRVFKMDDNIYQDIPVSSYTNAIVEDVIELGIDGAKKKKLVVDDIMAKANCNANEAISIYKFASGDFATLTTPSDLLRVFEEAVSINMVDVKKYTDLVYNKHVKGNAYPMDSSILGLIKYLYTNGDITIKEDIVSTFTKNVDKFMDVNVDPEQYVANFKSAIPFDYSDFIKVAFKVNVVMSSLLLSTDFNRQFLLYDMMVYAFTHKMGDKNEVSDIMLDIIKKQFMVRDFGKFGLLLKVGNVLGKSFEKWIADTLFIPEAKKPVSSEEELTSKCSVVDYFNDESIRNECITTIIFTNLNSPALIPFYIKEESANRELFRDIEVKLQREPEFVKFQLRKEVYIFKNKSKLTVTDFNNYLQKFYLKGHDKGLFARKIEEYIKSFSAGNKIKEIINIYTLLRDNDLRYSDYDMKDIYDGIDRELFSMKMGELINMSEPQFKTVHELENMLEKETNSINRRYYLLFSLFAIFGKFSDMEVSRLIDNDMLYKNLNSEDKENIAKKYTPQLLNMYLKQRSVNRAVSIVDLFAIIFGEYIVNMINYDNILMTTISELKDKEYALMVSDLYYIAYEDRSELSRFINKMIEEHVNSLKKGDAKKLFKNVLANIHDKEFARKVEDSYEQYLDTHKGFFEKLFGSKKKDKDDKDNKKDKDADEVIEEVREPNDTKRRRR